MEKRSFSVAWTDDPISCCRTCHSRTDQYLACRRCVDRIICCSCRSNSCMAVYCVYRGISSAPDFYEAFCNEIYQQAS